MFKNFYTQGAIIFVNTIIFLVLLNLALFAFYIYKDKNRENYENQISLKYGRQAVEKAYPHMPYAEVNKLLAETWNRPLAYDPYTAFQEKPFRGRYVNIDSAGFRIGKKQAPWPIDSTKYNVFVFGGSTTFGYGVADHETIPVYLQELLKDRHAKETMVYNFGTAFYYSVQEKLFLEKLLYQGQVPDLVIFIDGLNDVGVFDEPGYAAEMRSLYQGKPAFFFQKWFNHLPLVRLTNALKSRFLKMPPANAQDFCHSDHLKRCYIRYRQTKQMIEATAGLKQIQTLFVWQPSARYHYYPQEDLFGVRLDNNPDLRDCAYVYFAKQAAALQQGGNFMWLADLQKGKKQNLYVDKVHYSRKLNFMIADTLASYLSEHLIWKK